MIIFLWSGIRFRRVSCAILRFPTNVNKKVLYLKFGMYVNTFNPEGCATFYGCNKDSISTDILDSILIYSKFMTIN